MKTLIDLVRDPGLVDALLHDLHVIADETNHFECGLPLYDEGAAARLREAVYRWAAVGRDDDKPEQPR
jgi:hypothetical protein